MPIVKTPAAKTQSTKKPFVVRPQDGFQIQFLSSEADITIGGAAAGVGKTWCVIAAPLRHKDVPRFNAITFRRTTEQIRNPGGLWDKSQEIYPMFGMKPNEQQLEWYMPKQSITFKLAHLQYEKNVYDHDGSEYCLVIFDELQHFTKRQFIYLLSRNRSTCGVKPYVLATCNPDPDSFLAELVEWWIDQEEKLPNGGQNPNWGYPIKERIGIVRFFIIANDNYIWGDTKQEIVDGNPELFESILANQPEFDPHDLIKSITFISGSIFDNKELMRKDPSYLANLMSQDETEKLRLYHGNWKIRTDDECIFNSIAIMNLFDNPYPANTNQRYITCDAARFGKDWCTIWVWYGWKVVKLVVLTTSSEQEIVSAIEKERIANAIVKSKVIVDQDGVGGGVVRRGNYIGFQGGLGALDDPGTKVKEFYKNRKAQFAYRYAEKVNTEQVSLMLSNENVYVDGYPGVKVKIGNKIYDVRELIKLDHRAIRKWKPDSDGKKQINPKEDQKQILKGRSPDFFDGLYLRIWFDFRSGEIRSGKPTRQSLLERFRLKANTK